MEQLVEVFLELEKHPLRATGSLTEDGIVGPFAQNHTFSTPSLSLGPLDTAEEALTCIIKYEIEMVESGELSTLAIDNYLTHIWRLEQIPEMLANVRDDSFYIKHFDDKGDHILVDLETLEAGTGTALNSLSGMLTGWPSSNRICGDASAKSIATPTQREGDSGAAAREVNDGLDDIDFDESLSQERTHSFQRNYAMYLHSISIDIALLFTFISSLSEGNFWRRTGVRCIADVAMSSLNVQGVLY